MAKSGIFSKMVPFAAIFVVFVFCGCYQAQLANGKYDTTLSGRDDFMMVYNDRIAVRLRNPENDGRDGDYWSWIGDYYIENNRIWLDMDSDLAKKWAFHYNFYVLPNGIMVKTLGSDESFTLQFSKNNLPSMRRHQGVNAGAMQPYR